MLIARVPILQFLKAVREPFTIAFATTSSESALPKAMENMERLGVPKRIVGFVMPTGYSFNLTVRRFISRWPRCSSRRRLSRDWSHEFRPADCDDADADDYFKRRRGRPRAALVILLATLNSFHAGRTGPIGVAVIFGVDELMDMGRTSVNVWETVWLRSSWRAGKVSSTIRKRRRSARPKK
jgi:proton glutamate symport protein